MAKKNTINIQNAFKKRAQLAKKNDKLSKMTTAQRDAFDAASRARSSARLSTAVAEKQFDERMRAEYLAEKAERDADRERSEIALKTKAAETLTQSETERPLVPRRARHRPAKVDQLEETNTPVVAVADVQSDEESWPDCRERVDDAPEEVAPTIDELVSEIERTTVAKLLPSCADFSTRAADGVFVADKNGLRRWDSVSKYSWSKPAAWQNIIDELGKFDLDSVGSVKGVKLLGKGEYNAVFQVSDEFCSPLPPQFEADLPNVVFRVTRSDASHEEGEVHFRFKSIGNLARELFFTLFSAVNEFSPKVYASLIFPAVVDDRGVQLYGMLLVVERGDRDMGALLDEHENSFMSRTCQEYDYNHWQLEHAGRRVAAVALPVVFRSSFAGALNFDTKPANFLILRSGEAAAIDFDASMVSILGREDGGWEAAFLVNLVLISAHIRSFRAPALASGWVSYVRPLLLDLVRRARGTKWVFDAKIDGKSDFKEMCDDTEYSARLRLQIFVQAYFVRPPGVVPTVPFRARLEPGAPSLMDQMLRFILHGSIHPPDFELDSTLF